MCYIEQMKAIKLIVILILILIPGVKYGVKFFLQLYPLLSWVLNMVPSYSSS